MDITVGCFADAYGNVEVEEIDTEQLCWRGILDMLVSEMTREECEELLARLGFGRLACVRDNQAYVVPIYFASEPGHLYGFSTLGEKIEWMRSNPLVCVEADEVVSETNWASVVVRGRYEEFPDTPEYAEPRRKAQSRLENMRSLWWPISFASAQPRERFDRDIAIFYGIHVEQISGRRGSPDPAQLT